MLDKPKLPHPYTARVDEVLHTVHARRFKNAVSAASEHADIGMRFYIYDRNLTMYAYLKGAPGSYALVRSFAPDHPLYRSIESL